MPAFFKYLLLTILGLVCLGVGFFGSSLYFGARGALDGFASVCKVLDVAEKSGALSKEQRATLAAEGSKESGTQGVAGYLTSDCSKSPFEYMSTQTK